MSLVLSSCSCGAIWPPPRPPAPRAPPPPSPPARSRPAHRARRGPDASLRRADAVLADRAPRLRARAARTTARRRPASSIPRTASARPSTAAPTSTRPSTSPRAAGRRTRCRSRASSPGGRDRRRGGGVGRSRLPPHRRRRSRPGRRGTAASRTARSCSCGRAGARAGRTGSATWATTLRATPRGCTSRRTARRRRGGSWPSAKVAALGVDTASIDHGPSKDFVVHQIAAAANVAGLENLTGLDALPADRGLGHRAADEDRGRLRRPAAGHRPPALRARPRTFLQPNAST